MKTETKKSLSIIKPEEAISKAVAPPPRRHEVVAAAVKRAEQLFKEEKKQKEEACGKSKEALNRFLLNRFKSQQKALTPDFSYWSQGRSVEVRFSLVVDEEMTAKIQAHNNLAAECRIQFDEKETRRAITDAMRGGAPGDRVSAILANPETVKALDSILLVAGV